MSTEETYSPAVTGLASRAVKLLQDLIAIPSFSREEEGTAALLCKFLQKEGLEPRRLGHNIYCLSKGFDPARPTILLNSHHDTVKPNGGYTRDPFNPEIVDERLFGLGSNDAGGCLVSLLMVFLHFQGQTGLKYNFLFAASSEEEISGKGGIEALLPHLPPVDFAIVGEPTLMNLAVAERGLMVLDCETRGTAGHAARNEGENAIYKALADIEWFRSTELGKHSPLLGPSRMNVTVIGTENKAHNVVPDRCLFVVDVRLNELTSFEEALTLIRAKVTCSVEPRSLRLRSTSISMDHPVVQSGMALGRSCYGSPTTSDKALMPFPSLKMGPGDSARSHTADEFIYIREITEGIDLYIRMLTAIV